MQWVVEGLDGFAVGHVHDVGAACSGDGTQGKDGGVAAVVGVVGFGEDAAVGESLGEVFFVGGFDDDGELAVTADVPDGVGVQPFVFLAVAEKGIEAGAVDAEGGFGVTFFQVGEPVEDCFVVNVADGKMTVTLQEGGETVFVFASCVVLATR